MKRALVCGAGGFIAGHLVKRLKAEGYWVRGVDRKVHEFAPSAADEFMVLDLRDPANCRTALTLDGGTFDEVYQLAADMGGMGFIHSAECEIMHNSVLINVHMTHQAAEMGVPRYFYSSSVCVYPDMQPGDPEMTEAQAVPAHPDNEYGWEKLYSERMLQAYARHYGMKARIARFQNCYGPEGTWTGGREKAPAAICRKVAEVEDGGTIPVWGDGTAVRSYTYVSDMVDGIYRLMHSDLEGPGQHRQPGIRDREGVGGHGHPGVGQTDQRRMGEGAGGGAEPQLQQRAHLLDRLARPRLHAGGDPAHVSVDRRAGAEGAGGEIVMACPSIREQRRKQSR